MPTPITHLCLALPCHIESAQQRTIIQQYGAGTLAVDGWAVTFDSEEGPKRAAAPPSILLTVPNVTVHPLMVSVPTSHSFIHLFIHSLIAICKAHSVEDVESEAREAVQYSLYFLVLEPRGRLVGRGVTVGSAAGEEFEDNEGECRTFFLRAYPPPPDISLGQFPFPLRTFLPAVKANI